LQGKEGVRKGGTGGKEEIKWGDRRGRKKEGKERK